MVVTIEYNLLSQDLTSEIEAAFGKDGLGVILVKGVPV
jgi:hypothetical protein